MKERQIEKEKEPGKKRSEGSRTEKSKEKPSLGSLGVGGPWPFCLPLQKPGVNHFRREKGGASFGFSNGRASVRG